MVSGHLGADLRYIHSLVWTPLRCGDRKTSACVRNWRLDTLSGRQRMYPVNQRMGKDKYAEKKKKKTAEDFDKWLRYVWEDFLYMISKWRACQLLFYFHGCLISHSLSGFLSVELLSEAQSCFQVATWHGEASAWIKVKQVIQPCCLPY